MKNICFSLAALLMITAGAAAFDMPWGILEQVGTVAADIFLGVESGYLFVGYDKLAHPNEVVTLQVHLQDIRRVKPVTNAQIVFYEGSERIGSAETDSEGRARLAWRTGAPGDHYFEAAIERLPRGAAPALLETAPARLRVSVRDPAEPFVVVDLDRTLVDSSFFRVLLGGGAPMPHSRPVMERLAAQYSIIYLTHRPDLLGNRSRDWLETQRYPAGVLVLGELRDSLGPSGTYKTAALADISTRFPNLVIGIGDKPSDAQSYIDNHMDAYLLPHYDNNSVDKMLAMAAEIEAIEPSWQLHVVRDWREIERGVFDEAVFPPGDFAEELRARSERLRRSR